MAGKAKQKNVTKSRDHVPADNDYGRILLDISTIMIPKEVKMSVTKPHWRIMVDERTGLKLSGLFQANNGIIEPTCVKFSKSRQGGQPVRLVVFDNYGGNLNSEQLENGKDWKMDINVYYKGLGTQHMNHLAELAFTMLV